MTCSSTSSNDKYEIDQEFTIISNLNMAVASSSSVRFALKVLLLEFSPQPSVLLSHTAVPMLVASSMKQELHKMHPSHLFMLIEFDQ